MVVKITVITIQWTGILLSFIHQKQAEAEPGPSKREEWMTELPPEMGKNFGLTTRTFSKGTGSDSKDRSDWTDTPADKVKKERDGKSKKRKKDETVEKNISKRDAQLQQQVEEYNVSCCC